MTRATTWMGREHRTLQERRHTPQDKYRVMFLYPNCAASKSRFLVAKGLAEGGNGEQLLLGTGTMKDALGRAMPSHAALCPW